MPYCQLDGTHLRGLYLWMGWDQERRPENMLEGRLGPTAISEDKFCVKVDCFGELYGLKTLDYYERTRDDLYQLEL